jgi:hypothetical protein
MKIQFILLAATSLFALDASATPPNMQPGMWEITTRTEMPGMPMQMPPQSIRQCYKNENVRDARETLPVDKTCKVDDFQQSGNTVKWKVNCKVEGAPMTGIGEITYAGSRYSGKMTMQGNMQGMNINMTSQYSGRRVGDCK